MELCSIASGSSGNCICVGSDDCHVLIDAGISGKRIENGLNSIDLKTEEMKGVLVTHEHIDHISGLGVIARRYGLPIYATEGTIDAILNTKSVGKIDESLFHAITPEQPFEIGDLLIEPISISHDAADPVCYTVSDTESKVGVATDFGTYDEYLVEKMQGCESLLVESNHDLNMLMVGPYPYPLKKRIMGNKGHLSNERAGQFLSKVIGEECKHIFLGHLSKENNYGELAYETVKVELLLHNIDLNKADFTLQVASRTAPTCVI